MKINHILIVMLIAVLTLSCFAGKNSLFREKNISPKKEIIAGGITFIYIPAGEFTMGAHVYPEESPAHRVKVSHFWMSKYEITQKQFRDVMGYNPLDKLEFHCGYGDNYPVYQVTWHDAMQFCRLFREKHGIREKVRLPYEAEWEYAARAGGRSKYPWGSVETRGCFYANMSDNSFLRNEQSISRDQLKEYIRNTSDKKKIKKYKKLIRDGYAPFHTTDCEDGYMYTAPVGKFYANDFGLHDMAGNVMEWCMDWFGYSYYKKSVNNNPRGPKSGDKKVVRGGSWRSLDRLLRSAFRMRRVPTHKCDETGFRIVISERR